MSHHHSSNNNLHEKSIPLYIYYISKEKVYDVYIIPTNILLHRYNLYNHIWLNQAINLYSVSTDNTQIVHKVHVMHIC